MNSSDLHGIGAGKTPEDLAKKHGVSLDHIKSQLAKGMKVEKEHTDKDSVAIKIATDHVYEDPNYYTKLQKMEKTNESILPFLKSLARQIDEGSDADYRERYGRGPGGPEPKNPERDKAAQDKITAARAKSDQDKKAREDKAKNSPLAKYQAKRRAETKTEEAEPDAKTKEGDKKLWDKYMKDAKTSVEKERAEKKPEVKNEDAPVNNVGSGNIAGTTKDNLPGVDTKKKDYKELLKKLQKRRGE